MKQNESLYDFLARRERELVSRTGALRHQLDLGETELANVRTLLAPFLTDHAIALSPPYEEMTIKQLVQQAFIDNFQLGATAAELHAFIQGVYGRRLQRGTLAPQLHRLKLNAVLEHDKTTGIWRVARTSS